MTTFHVAAGSIAVTIGLLLASVQTSGLSSASHSESGMNHSYHQR